MSRPIEEIERILASTEDVDDALRRVVATLVEEDGVHWAAIAFVEDGRLTLGPTAGTPDEATRERHMIAFSGDPVGELLVDGGTDEALLARVAQLIAPYVLIGWDTGGDTWDP